MPSAQILNVDDYVPGRYARTRLLKQAGYTVAEAGTGAEALNFINREHPDVVLLDINLPDISGLEVCQKIKSEPATSNTAVLQISASMTQSHHQVEGLNSGADGYLVEPVDPSVLLATIRALLRARQAEDALRRSNDDLRHFAYMVSHEMTEPLRMITSYTQLIANRYQGRLDPDADEFLSFITSGAARMKNFLGDLLSYSHAVNAERRFHRCSTEVILAAALSNLELQIKETGANIERDPLPDVIGDDTQITHVFQNLISNALKYRREEVPTIHIGAKAEGDMCRFSISDNGVGIDPKYFEQIFTIFKRLHGRDVPGTGIGLALCKRIIEAHGGQIGVESQPDVGSKFFFTLPKA